MSSVSTEQVPWRWRKLLGIERLYWLMALSVALTIGAICGLGIVISSWSIMFAVGMTGGMFLFLVGLLGLFKLFIGDDTSPGEDPG